ncbi:MAG: hypothetical protein HY910_15145 [Desulfarculus sp.]|nr:hypothetical protein [Desulfarculus sp.]
MKILVCLKQVPEPESHLQWLEDGGVAPVPGARFQMGSLDAQALEWALTLAQDHQGISVEAVCAGPARAAAVLERARGMGAAQACHILTPEGAGPPALTLATWLAAWAGPRAYDLILTGGMSQDAMRGQVGPLLAGLLGLNWATLAVDMRLTDQGRLHLEREVEAGRRQALELDLPALVTVQSSPREPRYPSLSGLLKAKASPPQVVEATGLPPRAPQVAALGARRPQRRRAGRALNGTLAQQAQELCAILRQRGLL